MNVNKLEGWAEIDVDGVIASETGLKSSEALFNLARTVAVAEVMRHWGQLACKIFHYAEQEGENGEELLRKEITDALVNGADDTWSGRGNDLQRVRYDALRQIAREIL